MEGRLTAEVILRNSEGRSILDATEGITADVIASYRVSQDVIDEVSGKLEALGFDVIQTGPVSITMVGDPVTFEQVFQTKLVLDGSDAAGVQRGAHYQPQEPIQIPVDLAALVAAVTLPVPPEFHP